MITSGNSGLLEEMRGSVTRLFVAILAALLLASMFAPPITRPAQAEVNDPGRAIEVFYERNLVLATGYPTDTKVRIDVIRAEQLVGSVTGRTDADGNLEINHVGGNDCWGPNDLDPNAPNVTPDIKPGDKVQTTVLNEDGTPKLDASGAGDDVDFTVTRDVAIDMDQIAFDDVNGTITVKGHVKALANADIQPGDVLEVRMNKANRDNPWGDNADPASRRSLNADITADVLADGSFTHTFEGLSPEDVVDARENGVDQILEWARPVPGGAEEDIPEITVFDESEGVPPGCPALEGGGTAPADQQVPNVHKALEGPLPAGVDAPRSIEVFHGIEMVGLFNYPAKADVRVDVVRNGLVIGSTTHKTDATGLLEINHVGGGLFPAGDCWDPAATPNIRPGDTVLSTILSSGEQDSAVVRDVYINNWEDSTTKVDTTNNTITISGHARGANITPTEDVLELRLNANGFGWDVNGERKDLRADVGAEVQPDGTFTHVFQVSATDARQASTSGFEQMIEWSPAVAEPNLPSELTVFDGEEGALPGCSPLLERNAITTSTHPFVNGANRSAAEVVLGGVASGATDNVSVSVNGKNYAATLSPLAGHQTWTASIPMADLAGLPDGQIDALATFTEAAVGNDPAQVAHATAAMLKDTGAPAAVAATPQPGTYNAAQQVELSAEQGTKVYYTTDGSAPTERSTLYSGPIAVNNTQTIQAIAVDRAGNHSGVATFGYTIEANDTALSLSASPQSFTSGETGSVTLSGKLTSGVNGVGAQRVVLEKRPYGATSWGQVGTPTTATDGSFSFAVAKSTITRNTDFRVLFVGAEGYKASESATQQVLVQARVTLNASATSLRLGREVTFSGTVSPAHPGQRVTVTVVRNTATGSTTVATLSPTLTSNSSYSVRYKPAVRGNYSVVASFSDADHALGQSAPRSFSVT